MGAVRRIAMSETTIVVICIVGAFLGALVLAYRYGQKHRQLIDELAAAQGWTLSRTNTEQLAEKLGKMLPYHRVSVSTVMTVELGERNMYLVDGAVWRYAGEDSPGFSSLCILESAAVPNLPTGVEVFGGTKIDQLLLEDQVDMGNTPFAKEFIVQSKDRESAWRLLDPAMQQVFLDHWNKPLFNPATTLFGNGHVALLAGRIDQEERWLDLVEFAGQIESCLARQGGWGSSLRGGL
jgi:hypothetical protein